MTGKVATLVRAGAGYGPLRRLHGVERSLIAGTTGTIVLNVVQVLLNFALTLSLSRLLGADGLGAYAYAFAWAGLLAGPSVLGLTPLVVRNVAAYREREQWGLLRGMIVRANHAVLVSSGVLVAIGAIAGLIVNHSRNEFLFPVLVALLLVPIVALTSIRQAAMQGLGRVVLGRTPETLVAPVLFLAFVGAGYVLAGSFSATWAVTLQVLAFGLGLVLGAVLLRRVLPHRVRTERPEHAMSEWVRSAIPLLVLSLVQGLNTQMEVILLGAIKGSTEAGLLTVASRAAGVVAFVMVAVGYPLSPLIARLHASGQSDLLRRTVRRTALTVFLASIPVAVGVIVFAHPLLRLFGAEFTGGVTALILLVLGQLAFAATGLAGTVLVMTGHESWLLRGAVVGAVANIVLNAALIPPFGLNGAAAGTAIALTAMNICMAYFARRRAGVPATALGF